MSIRSGRLRLPARYSECFRKKVTAVELIKTTCDQCGKVFLKSRTELHEHNFCCRDCFYQWNSRRISEYNRTENPINQPGGVLASRLKRGTMPRNSGDGKRKEGDAHDSNQ